jgi:hypothetical protein
LTTVRLAGSTTLALGLALLPTSALAFPRVAVQPFGGPETDPYRQQVAKIIGRHGFKVVTSLPAVSGTSQYPGLAQEKRLSAFVVADTEDRGERVVLSFLVWQGIDGSVIGRWEVAGPKKLIAGKLGREFWRRLGPAIGHALAPPSDELSPAPPMRINAGPPTRAAPIRRKAARPSAGPKGPRPVALSI